MMLISKTQFAVLIMVLAQIYPSKCLIQACINLAASLSTANESSAQRTIKELQDSKCLTSITPRYKWSQNMSHIQVKIEFLATTQTAPCDKVLYKNTSISHNAFEVRVFCLHDHHLIDYHLALLTYKSMDFQFAQWKTGQQNSILLECLKSPAPYFWPILHSRALKPKRTPKIWWQMLSRFGPELRKVIDLLQIGDNDHEISKKVKRKLNQPESSNNGDQYFCHQGSSQYLGSWF